MSTKSSLALSEWNEKRYIHIYREMVNGKYYIETHEGKLWVPENVAQAFAKALPEKGETIN